MLILFKGELLACASYRIRLTLVSLDVRIQLPTISIYSSSCTEWFIVDDLDCFGLNAPPWPNFVAGNYA